MGGHYHSPRGASSSASDPAVDPVVGVGVDIGATLAKIVFRDAGGRRRYELLPSDASNAVARAVVSARPAVVGLTGGGAAGLARSLSLETTAVPEFDAWGVGAAALLAARAGEKPDRFLLVSVGTGTSIILFDGGRVVRLGGTPLGGGTLLGLGAALVGSADYAELCELASRGSRSGVDLTVGDIYAGQDDVPLAPELTASAFARLGRSPDAPARREDLACALVAMIGENVALIAGGLAAAARVERVVVAGSVLRSNPLLEAVFCDILGRFGRPPEFLPDGAFGGALGALLLAERNS